MTPPAITLPTTGCEWRLLIFLERDACVGYEWADRYGNPPSNTIQDRHVLR